MKLNTIVNCPHCQCRFKVDKQGGAQQAQCPNCAKEVRLDSVKLEDVRDIEENPLLKLAESRARLEKVGLGKTKLRRRLEGTAWSPGACILDEYRIESRLGAGGMGQVYLARSVTANCRYAVKRAHIRDLQSFARSMSEVQSWICLPDHPHITKCHFFRTSDAGGLDAGHTLASYLPSELAIFADFVSGGSLSDWIEGGRAESAETALDIAIQVAWGLDAAHAHGVVHGDVKPSNVLLSPDGVAKIADFGSSAIAKTEAAGKGTQLYRSPEQARGQAQGPSSDVWSWALTLLATLARGSFWRAGEFGADGLQSFLRGEVDDGVDPAALPPGVARVLERCLQVDLGSRCSSLLEASQELAVAYHMISGRPYHRTRPAASARAQRIPPGWQAMNWRSPAEWLDEAAMWSGGNPIELQAANLPPGDGSDFGAALADIATYSIARCVFERLLAMGMGDAFRNMASGSGRYGEFHFEARLARMCLEAAQSHIRVNDLAGALELAERALEILEELAPRTTDNAVAVDLADAYYMKAILAVRGGRRDEALDLYGKGVGALQLLIRRDPHPVLKQKLTVLEAEYKGLQHQAARGSDWDAGGKLTGVESASQLERVVADLVGRAHRERVGGNPAEAKRLLQEAIARLERCIAAGHVHQFGPMLGVAHANLGNAERDLGNDEAALQQYNHAIDVNQRVLAGGAGNVWRNLAGDHICKGDLFYRRGEFESAASCYGEAAAVHERLFTDGSRDHVEAFAAANESRANALLGTRDFRTAAECFLSAMELYRIAGEYFNDVSFYKREGQVSLRLLDVLGALRAAPEAIALSEKVVRLWEDLVYDKRESDSRGDLARAYTKRGMWMAVAGNLPEALERYEQAMAIWGCPTGEGTSIDWQADRAITQMNRSRAWAALGEFAEEASDLRDVVETLQNVIPHSQRRELRDCLEAAIVRLREFR